MIKNLRSLIQEKFPLDLRVELDVLSRRRDIINEEKQEELFKVLRKYDVKMDTELGPGTNRYAFKLDGFVIKVATDHDGKIDNLKEFKMAKRLYPHVSKTYEVSKNGTLLVAEYIQPFTSYSEMLVYADDIREILTELSAVYLIGDVGISQKNYANWGLRVGTSKPVCLDFAYIYEVSSSLFVCRKCKASAMLLPNKDFTSLFCSNKACMKETSFEEIRGMIGNDIHRHEIGDLTEEGYEMFESNVVTELTTSRSNYLLRRKVKPEKKPKPQEETEFVSKPFIMEHEPDYYMKEDNEMGFMENAKVVARAISAESTKYTPGRVVINATAVPVNLKDAKPVEEKSEVVEDDGLAFSGSIKPNTEIKVTTTAVQKPEEVVEEEPTEAEEVVDTPPAPVVTVTETSEEPEEEVEETVEESAPDEVEEPKHRFTESFINNMWRSVSKIGNRVSDELYASQIYDQVRTYCRDKNMYPETFYKNVQNAVFRSICMFLNFEEGFEPNTNKPGNHKVFFPPKNIEDSEYIATIIFLERNWNVRRISMCEDALESLNIYRSMFNDCIGIEREWLPVFEGRLKQKMQIDNVGIKMISEHIASIWCVPEDVEPEDEIEETVEETQQDVVIEYETTGSKIQMATEYGETSSEAAFSGAIENNDDDYETEEPEDYEEGEGEETYFEEDIDDGTTMDVTISIIPDEDGFDIVRLSTGEPYGSISIPFYADFAAIDLNTRLVNSMVDQRNGYWDWLIHVAPDEMFYTRDPEKYLKVNDDELSENQIHIVILDNDNGLYTMGIYTVAGIYVYDEDEDGLVANFDEDVIRKINIIINENIGYGVCSYLKKALSLKDNIHEEEAIRLYVEEYFRNKGEDEDMAETTEHAVTQMPVAGAAKDAALTPEELAAIQAVLNDQPISHEDRADMEREEEFNGEDEDEKEEELEKTAEDREAVEEAKEPAHDPEPVRHDGYMTPHVRKKDRGRDR